MRLSFTKQLHQPYEPNAHYLYGKQLRSFKSDVRCQKRDARRLFSVRSRSIGNVIGAERTTRIPNGRSRTRSKIKSCAREYIGSVIRTVRERDTRFCKGTRGVAAARVAVVSEEARVDACVVLSLFFCIFVTGMGFIFVQMRPFNS